MRAGNLVLLTLLQTASTVLGAPAPAPQDVPIETDTTVPVDPVEALNHLQALGEATAEHIMDEINENNITARGLFSGCTLSKLQIRREWYARFRFLLSVPPLDGPPNQHRMRPLS